MDTSETYIKMCEKAEGIQGNHDYIKGDYMVGDFELAIKLTENPCVVLVTNPMTHTEATIWLPHQDQLQEMVGINPLDLDRVRNFIGDMENNHRDSWNTGVWLSWERLWLAFCMSEKFNKIWDGESWVVKK